MRRSTGGSVTVVALAAFLACSGTRLLAQDDPNLARGLLSKSSYQYDDIDAINLFNGNLTLSIPIGQTYRVNGLLSYGLVLYYNHKVWQLEEEPPSVIAYPDPFNNAALGWRLNMIHSVHQHERHSGLNKYPELNQAKLLRVHPDKMEQVAEVMGARQLQLLPALVGLVDLA